MDGSLGDVLASLDSLQIYDVAFPLKLAITSKFPPLSPHYGLANSRNFQMFGATHGDDLVEEILKKRFHRGLSNELYLCREIDVYDENDRFLVGLRPEFTRPNATTKYACFFNFKKSFDFCLTKHFPLT